MSELVIGQEADARSARAHALAVLRVRSTALALALLPAAVAVVLLAGSATGRIGAGWDGLRWGMTAVALLVLVPALCVAAVVVRARPAVSPTVDVEERSAPDLYNLVRDLADRLGVPAPSAVALTPDCDSWLEDRTHPAQEAREAREARENREVRGACGNREARWAFGSQGAGHRLGPEQAAGRGGPPLLHRARRLLTRILPGARSRAAPVLVIGSPFLWWMRVAELRALLAPVVAGTGPSAHPDIAAARRFVRGLDAAVAVTDRAGHPAPDTGAETGARARTRTFVRTLAGVLSRPVLRFVGAAARLMLRAAAPHAAEMERGVAAAASARAQGVDHGLRVVAQEQVGLAYAGWDRLLTRVALPAWRIGRWPSQLDAGVVSALTELSRRDRLAEGFTSRLGERPACDLLEEPGAVDESVSLLAARLFVNVPAPGPAEGGAEWSPVDWSAYPEEVVDVIWRTEAARLFSALDASDVPYLPQPSGPEGAHSGPDRRPVGARAEDDGALGDGLPGPTLARIMDRLTSGGGAADALAARIASAVAREDTAAAPLSAGGPGDGIAAPMGLPLRPPRSGRELVADHITAAVCCAAVDTAGAVPGLDWLDGPALLIGGERRADLTGPVLDLVEDGDAGPLRAWLTSVGVRPDKPVRLV